MSKKDKCGTQLDRWAINWERIQKNGQVIAVIIPLEVHPINKINNALF
jgi:hypothetical protein